MYTSYKITLSGKNGTLVLEYAISEHRPAQIWAELTSKLRPQDLRKSLDPWRGTASTWDRNVVQFTNVVNQLNTWIPKPIVLGNDPFTRDGLNRLHIHFPELEATERDSVRRSQLSQYNDLIHCLQVQEAIIRSGKERMYLLLCADKSERVPLNKDDYQYFNPGIGWGDLTLHYPHVGRHPLEVYLSHDVNVPSDQIFPQRVISQYHTLRFHDLADTRTQFSEFYNSCGLQWPYKLDDPRLAYGYITLGKLQTTSSRLEIEAKIKGCNKIADWQIE